MKCPHCQKNTKTDYLENAVTNVENYGSSSFYFKCSKCKKKYKVYIQRKAVIHKPEKANSNVYLSYG